MISALQCWLSPTVRSMIPVHPGVSKAANGMRSISLSSTPSNLLNSIIGRTSTQSPLFNRPQHFTIDPMKCQVRHRYHYLRNRTRVKRVMLIHKASAEHEITRLTLKALHRSTVLPMQDRLKAMMHLDKMHSYTRGGTTELKVRCVETGRGNGVIAPWRISRIVWREAAINGHLPGVRACEYYP
jgi:small subunit ribosomal protein S14